MQDIEQKCVVYNDIPYAILEEDISGGMKTNFFNELGEIKENYIVYEKGADFIVDGTNGDYTASQLRFKKIRNLINNEARFMFSQPLEVSINKNMNGSKTQKEQNTNIANFINTVMAKNHFNSNIVKAAKDCFIGKRICILLNFNDETGISINFLNALEFYYEMSNDNLTKLVAFIIEVNADTQVDKRIRKKTYEMENGYCYVTEKMYDGSGQMLEEIIPRTVTLLESIPAWIVFNDGLVNDKKGESDVRSEIETEGYYSKLSNADFDAERKSMNTIKYAIDATANSTQNLSTSPGSFWDIQSDDNGVEQRKASVGQLESTMSYSNALGATLERIENQMHSDLSVPNIDSEKLQGIVASGKTLKAIYWPMIVRSNEKMLVWHDAIISMIDMIYTGALLYPNTARFYTNDTLPIVELDIELDNNYALPEDIEEEKNIDLAEVTALTMSKKAYMKKWRSLTDEEADEELRQIALERELLESASGFMPNTDATPVGDMNNNDGQEEQLEDEEVEESE